MQNLSSKRPRDVNQLGKLIVDMATANAPGGAPPADDTNSTGSMRSTACHGSDDGAIEEGTTGYTAPTAGPAASPNRQGDLRLLISYPSSHWPERGITGSPAVGYKLPARLCAVPACILH